MEPLTEPVTVVWVFIGILISLILPVAVKTLKPDKDSLEGKKSFWQKLKKAWKKYNANSYLLKLLAAIFVAFVISFLLDLEFYNARDAAMAGFAWESFVDKLFNNS